MNSHQIWQVVDEQRSSLADLLDELSEQEWAAASLCAGWRVREVAAHVALAHMGPARAVFELTRAGGFNRMIRDTAIREARRPAEELAPRLRAMVGSRKKAPGISDLEPMLDVLVHGQDIAIPLSRERAMPTGAAAVAATRAWEMGFPFHAKRRLLGLQLVATDHPWTVGDGPRVEGPISSMLLLLTGRDAAALPHLGGPGAPALQRRCTISGTRT